MKRYCLWKSSIYDNGYMLQDYVGHVWSKWSHTNTFRGLTIRTASTSDNKTPKEKIQKQLKAGMVPICFGHTIEYIQNKHPEYFI